MSWYYNYYIGCEKEGKLYPVGPYDANGNLHAVLERSKSFASDLHEEFRNIPKEMMSEELKKEFQVGEDGYGYLSYLPISELPSSDFIKRGYFLIEDVQRYQSGDDDVFYDSLSPEVYAARLLSETRLGPPRAQLDEAGEEYVPHSVADYMYFAYPDEFCPEYEAHVIKCALAPYEYSKIMENAKPVVILSQG